MSKICNNKNSLEAMDSVLKKLTTGSRIFIYVSPTISFSKVYQWIAEHMDNTTGVFLDNKAAAKAVHFDGLNSSHMENVLVIDAYKHYKIHKTKNMEGIVITVISKIKSYEAILNSALFMSGKEYMTTFELATYMKDRSYYINTPNENFFYELDAAFIKMTPVQYESSIERVKEAEGDMIRRDISLRESNISYPEEILYGTKTDFRKVEKGTGWISEDTMDLLQTHAPKLQHLISVLEGKKKSEASHNNTIIYSQFENRNGSKLIYSILKQVGFDAIKVNATDSCTKQIEKYHQLSNSKGTILVTDVNALVKINNTTNLIIFDQLASEGVLNNFLRKFAEGNSHDIMVTFYVAIGPNDESTVDYENYRHMSEMLERRNFLFSILKDWRSIDIEMARKHLSQDSITMTDLKSLFEGSGFKGYTISF